MVQNTTPKFIAALEKYFDFAVQHSADEQILALRTKSYQIAQLLPTLLPSTYNALTSGGLPAEQQRSAMTELVSKLKQYSGDVAMLREMATRLSESRIESQSLAQFNAANTPFGVEKSLGVQFRRKPPQQSLVNDPNAPTPMIPLNSDYGNSRSGVISTRDSNSLPSAGEGSISNSSSRPNLTRAFLPTASSSPRSTLERSYSDNSDSASVSNSHRHQLLQQSHRSLHNQPLQLEPLNHLSRTPIQFQPLNSSNPQENSRRATSDRASVENTVLEPSESLSNPLAPSIEPVSSPLRPISSPISRRPTTPRHTHSPRNTFETPDDQRIHSSSLLQDVTPLRQTKAAPNLTGSSRETIESDRDMSDQNDLSPQSATFDRPIASLDWSSFDNPFLSDSPPSTSHFLTETQSSFPPVGADPMNIPSPNNPHPTPSSSSTLQSSPTDPYSFFMSSGNLLTTFTIGLSPSDQHTSAQFSSSDPSLQAVPISTSSTSEESSLTPSNAQVPSPSNSFESLVMSPFSIDTTDTTPSGTPSSMLRSASPPLMRNSNPTESPSEAIGQSSTASKIVNPKHTQLQINAVAVIQPYDIGGGGGDIHDDQVNALTSPSLSSPSVLQQSPHKDKPNPGPGRYTRRATLENDQAPLGGSKCDTSSNPNSQDFIDCQRSANFSDSNKFDEQYEAGLQTVSAYSDQLPTKFENALNELFSAAQDIASCFSELGEAITRQDISLARQFVNRIEISSSALLAQLMVFMADYVNDPLLIPNFADLVRKFESCATNFSHTTTLILSSDFGSSSHLQISASTRAFSSGISGVIEFLMSEKLRLSPATDSICDSNGDEHYNDRDTPIVESLAGEQPSEAIPAALRHLPVSRPILIASNSSSPAVDISAFQKWNGPPPPSSPPPPLPESLEYPKPSPSLQDSKDTNASQPLHDRQFPQSHLSTLMEILDQPDTVKVVSAPSSPPVSNESIWLESNNETTLTYEQDANRSVKHGSLNQLIIYLTHETKSDMEYMKTFLYTYHSFTSPEVLMAKLFGRYFQNFSDPESTSTPPQQSFQQIVRMRVINAFRLWLKIRFDDFASSTLAQLYKFIELLRRDGQWISASDTLSKLIELKEVMDQNAREDEKERTSKMTLLSANWRALSPVDTFFNSDLTVFAQQLSLTEFSIWKKLKPSELMNQAWLKPELKHQSPHVVELVSRFNSVSHWVASMILWQDRLIDRVRVLSRFIELAAILEGMNNFNSMLEILSGFSNAAVHRLKFTFAELSKKHQSTLERLNKKMHSELNYKFYRDELRHCNPPVLPYMGVYLTDLIFVEDGLKSTVDGLINFYKRRQLYKVLREIEQYQATPYDFPWIPHIQLFLAELPHNDAEELYRISLIIEPRGTSSKKTLV